MIDKIKTLLLGLWPKIKAGLIIAAILFVAGLMVTVKIQAKRNKALTSDNSRLSNNNFQLMGDAMNYENYYLKEKEVTGKLKRERDSLAKSLSIKPKFVEKIITITNIQRDTVKISVPVTIIGKDYWKIADSSKCFKWQANALKRGDSLFVERTNYESLNKTTGVYYRNAKFIWFIRVSKFKNFVRFNSTCGNPEVQEFSFIK